MKVEEMSEYGKLVYKLAVIHDVFEMQDLAELLRNTTEFSKKNQTLYYYLKGERTPPAGFSDQLRRALNLNDEMYHMLLYVYDKATGRLSPVQREQTQKFEQMLRDDVARRFLENGGGAAN
jgi:hypothetical protein